MSAAHCASSVFGRGAVLACTLGLVAAHPIGSFDGLRNQVAQSSALGAAAVCCSFRRLAELAAIGARAGSRGLYFAGNLAKSDGQSCGLVGPTCLGTCWQGVAWRALRACCTGPTTCSAPGTSPKSPAKRRNIR